MNKIFLLIIVSAFCGGSVYPLIKIADTYDIPKFAYIFWESLSVMVLLIVISIYQKEFSFLKYPEWKYYGFCAFTNILIPQSLFFILASNMPATIISLIIAITPILVYSALIVFFQERFIKQKGFGLLLGFIGLLFLFYPTLIDNDHSLSLWWLLFSMSVPAVYCFNRLFVTRFQPVNAPPYRLAMGLFFTVCVISGIGMIVTNTIYIPFTSINYGDLALAGHAVLMTVFYICFFIISKHGAVKNSLTFYLAPLVGTSWGILLFSEGITLFFGIALICIFYALYLIDQKTVKT